MHETNEHPKSFGFLIATTSRLLRRRIDSRLRGTGLNRAQAQVLFFVGRSEGSNQACMAEALEIEPITLTRLLVKLEEAGWIERRADPKDRRIRRLYLTPKAGPMIGELHKLADEIFEEALDGVPMETRAVVMSALDHVCSNLSDRVCVKRQAEDSDNDSSNG